VAHERRAERGAGRRLRVFARHAMSGARLGHAELAGTCFFPDATIAGRPVQPGNAGG
jgi:hypothetical protein